jgi:hypothetical protein
MRKLIFWEFPRASWQYDVVVALILAFIFLTPRNLFRDQPRAAGISVVSDAGDQAAFWFSPNLLEATPEAMRAEKARELLRKRFGRNFQTASVEELRGSEKELEAFIVRVRP